MTLDEAIVHARQVASRKFDDRVHCIRCAEEHEQLAEWLEELKKYREIGTVEEWKNSVLKILEAYNKAIDDFSKSVKNLIADSSVIRFKDIDEIAEQLKDGGGE